jgi:hypothetical protein
MFSCSRDDLKDEFGALNNLISENVLTGPYLRKLATADEAR